MRMLGFAACLGAILGSPLLAQQCSYISFVQIHCSAQNCSQIVAVGVCSGYGSHQVCLSCANQVQCCGSRLCSAGYGSSCQSAAPLTGKVVPCDSTVRATAAKDPGDATTLTKEEPRPVIDKEESATHVTQTKTGS
jgi:hypothetical protein